MTALRFTASRSAGEVSAILERPADARWLFALAHGAGAGIEHPFMVDIAEALSARSIASFRYNFPYIEHGRRRPDPPALAAATVRSAVAAAADAAPDLRRIAGGKSFGGRMTSTAAAGGPLDVEGVVFLGFPLHPAGKPGIDRAAHLADVPHPMLFLQGTRDRLADPALIEDVVEGLGARASLRRIEHADHGFHVLKRSGRIDADVRAELVDAIAGWLDAR